MKANKELREGLINLAIPITLQSILQSSFGVIDQVMTGQLGSTSIAGIGLASKFSSLFSVLVAAVATVAGIMIAQYIGKSDKSGEGKSFYINMLVAGVLAIMFTIISCGMPYKIMSIYSKDEKTIQVAGEYLRIVGISFIPIAISNLLSTLLRCKERAIFPLISSVMAAVANTVLNYVLIFGKFGFAPLGANGAAIATTASQVINCLVILIMYIIQSKKNNWKLYFSIALGQKGFSQYLKMLIPILMCEFLWSLGENVYAIIYGHIGTKACAAMTLTTPIQVLFIGALSGVAQAAGIIIGKKLGAREYDKAYSDSKLLMVYGLVASVILSIVLIICSRYYVMIYNVEADVKVMGCNILYAFALVAPLKVQNMILSGGIIRSGGKTKYVMVIDIIGTWIFGVPLGLATAFLFGLPIHLVYFILSLEEGVRLIIGLGVFKSKKWLVTLEN